LGSIDSFLCDTPINESWPSWVPHWHIKANVRSRPTPFGISFRADNGTNADIETVLQDQNFDQLTLSGYAADSILDVGPVIEREDFQCVDRMLRISTGIHTLLNANSIQWDIQTLGKTLIAGTNDQGQRATEQECKNYLDCLNYAEKERALPPLLRGLDGHYNEDTLKKSRYDHALYVAMRARRFFVTKAGSMGLGTPTMEAGDIVAVLYGCGLPVVLRAHGEYHTVLGTCYVDGIMDGEAVRKFHAQGRKEDVFIIG
jgi:hypothetical protein